MKQRFSTLDVRVIAHELSATLPGSRIANIYDLSSRIFLFKFNPQPGQSSSTATSKQQLLVDAGFRCHLTRFSRTAATAPSAFVARLRKILRGRRVVAVRQVGWDRVIEITVGSGVGEDGSAEQMARQRRVFLEFFAAGNIVVTDGDLNVVALLREVREGDEKVDIRAGGKYRLDVKQGYAADDDTNGERQRIGEKDVREVLNRSVEKTRTDETDMTATAGRTKKVKKGGDDLKRVLAAQFAQYPVHLLEHAFKVKTFDGEIKPRQVLEDESKMIKLMEAISLADDIFRSLSTGTDSKGYIIAKIKDREAEAANDTSITTKNTIPRENLVYDDFHPFYPSQFQDKPGIRVLEISGFNTTVDEFYSSLESQKLTSRLTEREELARRKLQTAKSEHEKRLGALQQVQELHIRKAQAIEANTHRVEEACAALNGLIAQGMDWMDIGKLIENEQGRGNAVALLIKLPLKLYENTVTLLLDEARDDDESDDDEAYDSDEVDNEEEDQSAASKKDRKEPLAVDIDLALSPWANARQYYEQKKTAAEKEKKTIQASSRALKSTEKKIEADLKKGLKQETQTLRPARRQFFFEKFLYFISSEGYLVLGGKDPQQNEILYRRYLKKGDIYVHADLNGATSVVVKNNPNTPDAPIPPGTLSQAGALVVCTSTAWDSKAVMAAWWVKADQVSKTVESTGQYLDKDGEFYVRGEKNFLPPSQLLLGFGVLWLIDEEGRKNHTRLRGMMEEETKQEPDNDDSPDVKALSLDDPNTSATGVVTETGTKEEVPDVEEAANDMVNEAEADEDPQHAAENEEEPEHGSAAEESEAESEPANPLQTSGPSDAMTRDADEEKESHEHQEAGSESEDYSGSEEAEDDDGSVNEQGQGPASSTSSPIPAGKEASITPNATQVNQTKIKPPPRGKTSRAARLKQKKYAERQDEEDRALAMQLLGHQTRGGSKKLQKQEDEEQRRREREEKSKRDRERRRLRMERGMAAEEHRRRAQMQSSTSAGDDDHDDETVRQDLNALDGLLVPTPHLDDKLVAAVPVVAPWSALTRYKYKVKLQPGNLKRGKAVREILDRWTKHSPPAGSQQDRDKFWAEEIKLLKDWRMEEIFGVVPVGGVRIVGSTTTMTEGGNKRGGGKKKVIKRGGR